MIDDVREERRVEYRSEDPPDEHPDWRPAGEAGHFCVATRYCPCGHWNGGSYATSRADGRRGKPNIDVIEGNSDASR